MKKKKQIKLPVFKEVTSNKDLINLVERGQHGRATSRLRLRANCWPPGLSPASPVLLRASQRRAPERSAAPPPPTQQMPADLGWLLLGLMSVLSLFSLLALVSCSPGSCPPAPPHPCVSTLGLAHSPLDPALCQCPACGPGPSPAPAVLPGHPQRARLPLLGRWSLRLTSWPTQSPQGSTNGRSSEFPNESWLTTSFSSRAVNTPSRGPQQLCSAQVSTFQTRSRCRGPARFPPVASPAALPSYPAGAAASVPSPS